MDEQETGTLPRATRRRVWFAGAVTTAIVVVLAVASIFLIGGEREAAYPAGSPEAAFQAYAGAWEAGDAETAWAALTAGAQTRVPWYQFIGANRARSDATRRVWIDDASGTDDRVVLRLSVETIHRGGLLGSSRYRDESRVTLLREDGAWKIDTPLTGYFVW